MSKNTLQIFSTELGKLLFPLQQGFSSIAEAKALVEALGWQLPPGVDDLQLTAINVGDVVEKLKAILDSTSAEKEDDLLMATRYGELLVAITELISGIKTAMNTFSNLPGLTVDYLNTTQLHQKFFIRLIDLLIIRYFERNFYWFFSSLQLIGVFELEAKAEEPALFQSEHTRYTIFYDRLPRIFTEPAEVFAEVYGWGNANYDPQKLLNNLGLFFQSFGGQYRLGRLIRKAEEQFLARQVPEADADPMPMMSMSLLQGLAWDDLDVGLNFFGLRSSAPGGNDGGLGLVPYIKGTPEISFQLMENLFLEIETTLDIQGGLALFLRPGQGLQLKSGLLGQGTGSALASGKLMFEIRLGSDESEPVGLLGIPGGSGLYAQKLFMKSGAGVSDSRDLDIIIEGGIAGGKIILTAGEGDGFLQKVLPGDPMEIEFDLTIGVSSQKGFYIKGGAGLAYTFHINKQIGPILINSIDLGLKAQEQNLKLSTGLTGGVELGPLTAVVQNMGMTATFTFGESGNLGNADLSLGFKPPDGIGLSIDAEGITGGGFLSFDFENERYAGALELSFQDSFSLSAVGLITTRMPDGSKGFSLLIIITAEFATPIALGMNFYLAGVGGLLGLHRSVHVDNLRAGVKSNALDNILFPTDVVKNITNIISDLRAIFPPTKDQFIIGPMILITWSTPPLIRGELGLLIEFVNPLRVAILGVIKACIPTEEEALVKIQVNFLGLIDFEAGYLSFDATIYDSYIGYKSLKFSLAGDMALRISWGEKKDFVLSVGGFHPAFSPPAYLKLFGMKRLTISLLKDNPKLTLTTYFAITSNTVQFGSELDFYFKISKFKVIGYFGFDVLFQFSPFKFIAEIRAGLAVKLGSSTLFGIELKFELSGPTPWRAKGTGKFKILFISFKVKFDKTFGEKKSLPLPGIEVLPLVMEALENHENWEGSIPANKFLLVSLGKAVVSEGEVLMHAHGTLTIHQNILPLNTIIDLFGNYVPQDLKKLVIEEIRISDEQVDIDPVKDMFAPATYKNMEDNDKLRSASYVKMENGVQAKGGDDLFGSYSTIREVEYELIVSDYSPADENDETICAPVHAGRISGKKNLFEPYIQGGAVGQNVLSQRLARKNIQLDEKKIILGEEEYLIVNSGTLQPYQGDQGVVLGNKTEVVEALKAILSKHPEKTEELQVVASYQAAEE